MKTFRHFVEESLPERSPRRALKLLNYLSTKNRYSRDVKPGEHDEIGSLYDKGRVLVTRPSGEYHDIGSSSKIQHVPLHQISHIQSNLSPERVRKKIVYPHSTHGLDNRLPWIVKHQGKYHLIDGHHRLFAARLLRKPTLKAEVWDADDSKGEY